MISRFLIFVLAATALQVCSANTIGDAARAEELERIIMGRTASPGQFPYAAALYYNDQFICTSSILSPTTVLTAAHCVVLDGVQQPADLYYAIANVSKSAPRVRIDFASVTPHPDYNDQSIDNDVAVFKTTEDIDLGENSGVGQVCIARPNTPMMEYRKATAMGWGKTNYDRFFNNIPDRLQYVEQKIVRNSICSVVNPGITDDKICATGLLNGICNGDSGGPLVHLSADKPPVQIGIASYINGIVGCGKVVPGVWTRVSSYYDFIMQTAGDASICTV